jgi:RNA polymerase sigma factor (sigma-70 family)
MDTSSAKTWLSDLAGQSLGDFEATPELDQELSKIAWTARQNSASRDYLLTLLAMKIDRFSRRFQFWDLAPWDYDDVVQEAFIVFVATLQGWQPRWERGQPAGFLFYFLHVFPRRLADTVAKLRARGRRERALETVFSDDPPDTDPLTADLDGPVMVDQLCERLPDDEIRLLRLRVHQGCSVPQAAQALHITRRTAYRRWENVILVGRRFLSDEPAKAS